MKKTCIGLIACLLAVLLVGCGTDNVDVAKSYEISEVGFWTDGTYVETASGRNGDFEVTVVIKNGNIENIYVGENEETPDKGGKVIEQLPEKMKTAQSYNVDAISGATVTSKGLKDAVARCLEQASQEE